MPCVCLEQEYHLANAGQLRTRIGAFLEMITVLSDNFGGVVSNYLSR
ncbi:2-hydroxyacyl-CoA dehydratase family protein [Chloroflexota bacterium]